MAAGVREKARNAFRAEIAAALSEVFAERGFDQVTVEEAARATGISRATFFRYFGSKEDAVIAAIEASSIDYGAVLAALPAGDGENPWQLLHRTFARALAHVDDDPAPRRSRLRMINSTPSLRARLVQRRLAHEDALTAALAHRTGRPDIARPVVVAALAVMDLAWRRWAEDEDTSLAGALDEVFHQLADAATAPVVPADSARSRI